MKKVILATTLLALASGASASGWSNFANQIKDSLDPHKNGVISGTNGGYSSWKARERACHKNGTDSTYDRSNGSCSIVAYDKFTKTYATDHYAFNKHIGDKPNYHYDPKLQHEYKK